MTLCHDSEQGLDGFQLIRNVDLEITECDFKFRLRGKVDFKALIPMTKLKILRVNLWSSPESFARKLRICTYTNFTWRSYSVN